MESRSSATALPGQRRWLHPETRAGKVTLWAAVLVLSCSLLQPIAGHGAVSRFFGSCIGWGLFAFTVSALILLGRAIHRRLLWKVRNRLILTYVLMGLAPVVLFGTLAVIAIYVFAGQFSINSAFSGVDEISEQVKTEAATLADLLTLPEVHKSSSPISFEQQGNTREAEISAAELRNGTWHTVRLATQRGLSPISPFDGAPQPAWSQTGFHGVVVWQGKLFLCRVAGAAEDGRSSEVLAALPIDQHTLAAVGHSLGRLLIFSGYRGEHHDEIDNAEHEAQSAEAEADVADAQRDLQQQLQEAQRDRDQQLREAQRDQEEAQREGATQLHEAQRDVARAQAEVDRSLTRTDPDDREEAQHDLQDAQKAVGDAERQVQTVLSTPAPPTPPAAPRLSTPKPPPAATANAKPPTTKKTPAQIDPGNGSFTAVRGGALPALHLVDPPVYFTAPFPVVAWQDGQPRPAMLVVISRPSALYARLFANSVDMGSMLRNILLAIAIAFGCIELFALWMASRLSGTITRSIAELYTGTTEIDKGNLAYRVTPQRQDQLGSLAGSFNRMAGSIQDLLVQQREKDRLLNELAIAQEVQQNLFPHSPVSVSGLELHAVCLPARSVSGDYFDFIVGHNTLGKGTGACIALGDISGKGISAALLMATLHSAVRAFSLREELAMPSPAQQLELLNKHLYGSTQSNRYATLFLAFYDGQSRRLTYANGGHLPPVLISTDGTVQRLTKGGPVVGLLENLQYEEAVVELRPGDLLVAFTDGITEPEDKQGDEFGEAQLLSLLEQQRGTALPQLADSIFGKVNAWIAGQEQPDDMTLLLARLR